VFSKAARPDVTGLLEKIASDTNSAAS